VIEGASSLGFKLGRDCVEEKSSVLGLSLFFPEQGCSVEADGHAQRDSVEHGAWDSG